MLSLFVVLWLIAVFCFSSTQATIARALNATSRSRFRVQVPLARPAGMGLINQPRTKAPSALTRPQVGRSPRKKARKAGLLQVVPVVLVREELVAELQEVLA